VYNLVSRPTFESEVLRLRISDESLATAYVYPCTIVGGAFCTIQQWQREAWSKGWFLSPMAYVRCGVEYSMASMGHRCGPERDF